MHIIVFMASFRSSCSFVKKSFMDLESSVAAMRFLLGVGDKRYVGTDKHNTLKSLCNLESKCSFSECEPTDSIDF